MGRDEKKETKKTALYKGDPFFFLFYDDGSFTA